MFWTFIFIRKIQTWSRLKLVFTKLLCRQYVPVTRPFCLVKSRLQDAAANAWVLSVYPTTILYYHHQLFFDIKQENNLNWAGMLGWIQNAEKLNYHKAEKVTIRFNLSKTKNLTVIFGPMVQPYGIEYLASRFWP